VSGAVGLVAFGDAAGWPWPLGPSRWCSPTVEAVREGLASAGEGADADDWLLLWDAELGPPTADVVRELTREPVDVAHAGLRLGTSGLPRLIDTIHPVWPFNRDLGPSESGMSWRASFRACLVSRAALAGLGAPRPEFSTLDAAALEWGHRLQRRGAVVVHRPELAPSASAPSPAVPLEDELRFVLHRYGLRWLRWAVMRTVLAGEVPRSALWSAYRMVRRERRPVEPEPWSRQLVAPDAAAGATASPAVTVMLPTIDRYPSLRTLLGQLTTQTHPPAQVVIVDQTPPDRRDADLARDFPGLPVELLHLEQAGQSTARNAGLARTTGDVVLFLDDDDEVGDDLIERHLRRLAETGYDASCGVADEVGAGPLPADFELRRLSDVFPTNNTMLRTAALAGSGLFDLAYDHGPRADGDLGMRLYLSGAMMLLSPDIRVLHKHVPRGGLRTHGARAVTYASSRSRLRVRHLPAVTELYLWRRYFTPRQVREAKWIRAAGTFSIRGGRLLRLAKIVVAAVQLPSTLCVFARRDRAAREMLETGRYPSIPAYGPGARSPGGDRP